MDFSLDKDATIVILTGAGISRESGLDTFRCADGIWSKVDLQDVATPEAFLRDPKLVHGFYNARRGQLVKDKPEPNAAHLALVELEKKWPGTVVIVTQNIDNLHEKAGSQNIMHMHGELLKIQCNHCEAVMEWEGDLSIETPCPHCAKTKGLRPHVVWFGEMPLYMEEIYQLLDEADLFLSIGTSGTVYPAAGFVQAVGRMGPCETVEINLEPSEGASLFKTKLYGPATEEVPAFVSKLLESQS